MKTCPHLFPVLRELGSLEQDRERVVASSSRNLSHFDRVIHEVVVELEWVPRYLWEIIAHRVIRLIPRGVEAQHLARVLQELGLNERAVTGGQR